MNDDRTMLLVTFGVAGAAVVTWATAAVLLRRRRSRLDVASMAPITGAALATDVLSNGTRFFYEGRIFPDLPQVKRHLKRLTGATLVSEIQIPGGSEIWKIRFNYREHEFEIEMNYH